MKKNQTKSKKSKSTVSPPSLTSTQLDMLQEIQHRDEYEIDRQLDEIGQGLLELKQIAQLQGEEVRLQTEMLNQVQKKTEKNQSKLSKVLSRFRS